MTPALWLAIGEAVWVTGLCVWIILERRSPAGTLAWVFALAWLPVLGIPVYLVFGPRRLRRKKLRYRRGSLRVVQASGERRERTDDGHRSTGSGSNEQLVTLAENSSQPSPSQAKRVDLLFDGDACYDAIDRAILEAQHHVHLEYYTWEPDKIGTRFRDLLAEKARSGVEVRLLVDAIGSSRLGRRFIRPLEQAGAAVAQFNPVSLARLRPDLVNFRTHRKIVVCDGRIGFTGGINICDEQAATVTADHAWRDTHLQIEGPPVGDLQVAFLEDWHFATGGADCGSDYFPQRDCVASGPWVQILASGPDEDSYSIEKFCFAAITGAQDRVLVTTPYFVPTEPLLSALTTAAMRGVDVRVLVPHRGDSRLVMAAARSYFEELVRAGVRIYEYGPPMLHAKTLVVDGIALVGTANMDNRSFRLNFEVAAAIFDDDIAELLVKSFDADVQHAVEYHLQTARETPFRQRVTEATARLLSPLL